MRILVVCSNPLFIEVLTESIKAHEDCQSAICTPSESLEILECAQPDVIIVDESLGIAQYEPILKAARERTCSHIILISPCGNELVIIDTRRGMLGSIDDLYQALGDANPTQPTEPGKTNSVPEIIPSPNSEPRRECSESHEQD